MLRKGKLHAFHVQLGVQVAVGGFQYYGSQLLGSEYEVQDYGNQYACNGCECSQYDTGQFEYFLGLTFHFVIRSVNIGQGVISFP